MKKQMIWGVGLILLISVAFAIYGGNSSIIFTFDKCKDLQISVNGSLNITDGEYSLNCGTNINNTWSCDCYDGFELIMNTTPLTINNYTLKMDYGYEEIVEVSTNSGGSSRRRYVQQDVVVPEPEPQINETEIIENVKTNTTIETKPEIEINNTQTNQTSIEIKEPFWTQYKLGLTLIIIMIALFFAGIGTYLILKIK